MAPPVTHPHNEDTDFTGQECWWLTAHSTEFLLLSISITAEESPGPRCRERLHPKTGGFRSIKSHPSSEFRSTLKSYHSSRTSHRISWGLWYDWTTAQLCPNHSAFYTFSWVLIQRTHPSQPPKANLSLLPWRTQPVDTEDIDYSWLQGICTYSINRQIWFYCLLSFVGLLLWWGKSQPIDLLVKCARIEKKQGKGEVVWVLRSGRDFFNSMAIEKLSKAVLRR